MSQRFVQSPWVTDVFNTTNATPTVSSVTSFVIPSGAVGFVEIRAVLRNTTTGVGAMLYATRPFQNIVGTLTLLGALTSIVGSVAAGLALPIGNAGLLTAGVDLTTSGTTVQPRVTGIAATNIEWLLDVRYCIH